MKLYTFVSQNVTNVWAGIGARLWAVSMAQETIMKARATRAKEIRIGNFGIIYCSDENNKSLMMPFIFRSQPKIEAFENNVWPERWAMPFEILPLGTPRKQWNAHDAARTLPFNAGTGSTNPTSVFKAVGTAVFSPVEIGEDDWQTLIRQLAD